MIIQKQNYSLKAYNTFGIDVRASSFIMVKEEVQLREIIRGGKTIQLILGGGSNILLTKDIEGLVIKNDILGIEVVEESEESVIVRVGGGENWHDFVCWCLERDYGGVENLSLIPGTVGAAPIQNIGAYGVELKEVFVQLEAIELASGRTKVFTKSDCEFGYRDSIFKREAKGKYLISRVQLKLTKKEHQLHCEYGAVSNTLNAMGVDQPSIQTISKAIISIRSSKLPNPKTLGNSGSFFKNPEVEATQFNALQALFPNIVHYPLPNKKVKIPAGWLIEQCGWKGKRLGAVGSYEKQALVLVNYGGAKGHEVAKFANDIQNSVLEKFGILLVSEVNIL